MSTHKAKQLQQIRQVWDDEQATQTRASTLAMCAGLDNALIEFQGGLGAGKTTFIRHLLVTLGIKGHIKSPTYALVESYESSKFPIWHFDFYRFNDPLEWEDAGLRDIFSAQGLKLVEWPQMTQGLLPLADLVIEIVPDAAIQKREVQISAYTQRGENILQNWLDSSKK